MVLQGARQPQRDLRRRGRACAASRGPPRSSPRTPPSTCRRPSTSPRSSTHCDHGGGATVKTYSPDTSQAVVQSTTLASQAKQTGITTLLYFTDPVLPVYLDAAAHRAELLPGERPRRIGYLDFDPLAQLYDKQQWANAFGLGDLPQMDPIADYDAGAVYRTTHGTQGPYISADEHPGLLHHARLRAAAGRPGPQPRSTSSAAC